ncbi:glycosyltransferase 87 family protein [Microbacterium arborescens]|uniref:glycosyltransferase 87 family protein n=1 Tax=Microbacterium arborescens TaxID=33883 RepID=UPI001F07357B|nr:glycosyltransferase 87 family protein [Microbacterium arborescens]
MSRRGTLWVAFALVHVVVSVLGFVLPNQPMGDVYLVYEPWSQRALAGEGIVGIDEDWVYPQLALVPLVLAHGFAWIAGYTVGWAIFVTALDAVAFAILVGRARSRGRVTAAWFWLAAILLLGPVGLYRLDAVTVALAVMGGLWLRGRPWLAGILLAVATWIKVWPAAIIAAAVIAIRRRWALVGAGLVVSVATLAAVVAAGGLDHALGFIGDQTGRGLQVEAPVSMFYLWGQMLGVPGFFVYYSTEILTFQVTGTDIDPVIAAMTPILMIGVGAVAAVAALKVRRGAAVLDLLPVAALAIVTVFIVLNKVGSPQYLCWLVPPVVLGLVVARRAWVRPAILVLVLSALTQFVYPVFYGEVLAAHPLGVGILTVRNALLIVLGVWMVVRLVRVPVRTPSSIPA